MVSCGFKNGYKNDMCLTRIGLPAQNMLTILRSIVNIPGGTYMTIEWAQNLHSNDEQDVHTSSENCEESGNLVISCFISLEKLASLKK